ncbi:hypothetical protein Tco_0726516 [Tanacetum coccineum]|uniref:Uncharacterized protein n=1 Tax=Tanacetum coccineum TaxID=301880 RepID=A0ABQ4YGF9_9ASTR
MSSWKGNLPKLPIILKYSAFDYLVYSGGFQIRVRTSNEVEWREGLVQMLCFGSLYLVLKKIMSITKEQPQALDDALVPRELRLRIRNCNYRLSTTFKPKEPTFQVALDICLNLPGQKFVDPPFEEEILAFIRKLSYSRNIKSLSDVKVETLPQPWRIFRTINSKCLSGKVTGNDLLRLSRAQIIWGMYYQKNVDYVYLLWEDLVYQIKNKEAKRNKDMYYPRLTKVIINHFMSKDQSILRRNKVDWHMAKDDPILTTMRFIPKHETVQKYGAILPDTLTNQAMKESDAYTTYYDFSTGKVTPKPKYVRRSTREKTEQAPKASQGANKGASVSPKVPDVPTYGSEDEQISWKSSNEDNDDEVSMSKDDDDNADDEDDANEQTESDNDGDDFVHPKVHTPSHYDSSDDEAYDDVTQGDNVEKEKMDEEKTNEEDEVNELYNDVNINLERRDTEMTDAPHANVQATQVIEDTHVIITAVTPEVQQQSSSVSSGFISKMLNPIPDTCIDSILNLNFESTSLVDVHVTTHNQIPPSSVTTLPPPPIPLIQPLQQTLVSTTTIVLSTSLQNLPNFGSLFKFEERVKALENEFSEFKQTNPFAEAVSSIHGIVDKYLANQMNEAVKAVVQLKIKKSVNEQLEAEVLIRSSNEAKTSHAVAANLSELEVKKILIDKMENNKSIDISVQ